MEATAQMEPLGKGQVRLRVHGPDPASDEMSALVFADKLTSLVRAIRAADKAVNGTSVHEYMIARLRSSTPTAVLVERPVPKLRDRFISGHSGIAGFQSCVDAITVGERDRALRYGSCAKYVERLSKGAQSSFSYAEVWTDNTSIIRVDPLLTEQARSVTKGEVEGLNVAIMTAAQAWYKGAAVGSFDGEVRAVDLRGALPEIKLILTAGGRQIDCVCRGIEIETIRSALNRRVRLSGTATYDGKSGLPRRLEVSSVTFPLDKADPSKWAGSFEPFEIADWSDD